MGKIKRKSASPLCISKEFGVLDFVATLLLHLSGLPLRLCLLLLLLGLGLQGLQDHLGAESDVEIAKSRKVSTIINVNHGKPDLGDVSDVDIIQHDRPPLSTAQPALECNYKFISKANIQAQESYFE